MSLIHILTLCALVTVPSDSNEKLKDDKDQQIAELVYSVANSLYFYKTNDARQLADKHVLQAYIVTLKHASRLFGVAPDEIHKRIQKHQIKVIFIESKFSKDNECPDGPDYRGRCYGFQCFNDGWCLGLYIPDRSEIYLSDDDECVATNSFTHELIHVIAFTLEKDGNPKHDDRRLFPDSCGDKDDTYDELMECIHGTLLHKISTELLPLCL